MVHAIDELDTNVCAFKSFERCIYLDLARISSLTRLRMQETTHFCGLHMRFKSVNPSARPALPLLLPPTHPPRLLPSLMRARPCLPLGCET